VVFRIRAWLENAVHFPVLLTFPCEIDEARGGLSHHGPCRRLGRGVPAGADWRNGNALCERHKLSAAPLYTQASRIPEPLADRERCRRRPIEREDRHHQDRQVEEAIHHHRPRGERVLGAEPLTHRTAESAAISAIASAEPNGWFWASLNWSPMRLPMNSYFLPQGCSG